MSNVRRALVTGGAGFLGSHLCEALLAKGIEVTALDDLSTGRMSNIAGIIDAPGFSFVEADACEPFDFPADIIFHFASPASPVDYDRMRIDTMRVNSIGTMNALELAARNGARFVMASTSEIYGDPDISPQPESYHGNVNTLGPRSCYDEGKRFSEAICKAYEYERGVELVLIRIFNTYGPRMRENDGRVIPNFVCQALDGKPLTVYGDGSQTRSFCFVSDLVRGLVLAGTTPGAAGKVMNLGNPHEITMIELAEYIKAKIPTAEGELSFKPLPQDDPLQRRPDIALVGEVLGWKPEVEISDGLEQVIDWFRNNRE